MRNLAHSIALLPRIIAWGVWGFADIVSYLLADWLVRNGRTQQDREGAIQRRATAEQNLDRKYIRLGLPKET